MTSCAGGAGRTFLAAFLALCLVWSSFSRGLPVTPEGVRCPTVKVAVVQCRCSEKAAAKDTARAEAGPRFEVAMLSEIPLAPGVPILPPESAPAVRGADRLASAVRPPALRPPASV